MHKPKPSSFVMAALPSCIQHCNGVLSSCDHASIETYRHFFNNNMNYFLSSIGVAMNKGEKPSDKIFKRYDKIIEKKRRAQYLDNSVFFMDSAGFQIQCGYMKKEDVIEWINMYNDVAAEKYQNDFDKFFVVDVAPGSSYSVVDSWEEMEKFNVYSYEKTRNLPKELRDKFYYIHHFRTPMINKVYKKLLFEYDLADGFTNFSTGGLVSMGSSMQRFPVILYVVPLIHIVHYCKQKGIKKIKWHTLGASEYKDQLFAQFVVHHIKKVHDIEIDFTYDSSSTFKLLAQSRVSYHADLDNYRLSKYSVRQNDLLRMFKNTGKTNEDIFFETANQACVPSGMKEINKITDPIYVNGTMTRISYLYGFFHLLSLFRSVDEISQEIVDKYYPLYEEGRFNEFDDIVEHIMINFNNNKISKKLMSRSSSLLNSLNALTQLDLDYTDYLVNNYMGADECRLFSGSSDNSCEWEGES